MGESDFVPDVINIIVPGVGYSVERGEIIARDSDYHNEQ